jgi:hypothetical protein
LNSRFDLINQTSRARRKVQTNSDREKALSPETGEETGLEQRSLSQPGLTKKHCQQVSANPAQQFTDLVSSSMEIDTCSLAIRG